MEASLRSGAVTPISQTMLLAAARGAKPSTTAWFDVARNVAMFANEGGAYDELLRYMRARRLA
jgi:hypothetical protein